MPFPGFLNIHARSAASLFAALLKHAIAGQPRIRWILAAAVCLPLLPRLLLPPYSLFNSVCQAGHFFQDDLFYYFKPAINFWRMGYTSFDGITHTNGFQPLWMGINIMLALPFSILKADQLFPYAVLILNLGLSVYLSQLLYTLLTNSGLDKYVAALICVACLLPIAPYYLNGMESIVVLISFGLLVIYVQGHINGSLEFNPVVFAVLSFAVLLSRLDAGILLLLVYAVLLRHVNLRSLIISGILLCVFSAPYFTYNYVTQDSVVPISGQVKQSWSDLKELDIDGKVSSSFNDYIESGLFPRRAKSLRLFPGDIYRRYLQMVTFGFLNSSSTQARVLALITILMLGTAASLARLLAFGGQWKWVFLFEIWCCSALFWLFQSIYGLFIIGHVMEWYISLGAITLCITLGFATFYWLTLIPKNIMKPASILLIIGLSLFTFRQTLLLRKSIANAETFGVLYGNMIDWVRNNTPPDSVMGSWAAGQIGYYSERKVINLEGLAADKELLLYNKSHALPSYFVNKRIKFIIQAFPFNDVFEFDRCSEPAERNPGWHLRTRPIIDFRDCFRIIYTAKNRKSTGYVFEVDLDTLEKRLADRAGAFKKINKAATTIQAEDFTHAEGARVRLHIRNANRFAASGMMMNYSVENLRGSDYLIYAKAYSAEAPYTILFVPEGKSGSTVRFSGKCEWQTQKLSPEPLTAENGTIRFTLVGRSSVYIDEFYIVKTENEKALIEALASYRKLLSGLHYGLGGTEQARLADTI